MSGMWRVLRDRNGGAYLGAVVVSGFGTSAMMLVAGVWVMVLTRSTSLAALVTFLVWAPTLAGPLIGAVVDRVRRRRLVLVVSNLAMAALLLTLFAVRSAAQVWLILAVMLIYGISFVALDSAETAILPAAISDDLLGDINGMRMSASEGMKLVAPLVGAGLFAYLGGPTVALLDAVTFVIAAYLCSLIRLRHDVDVGPGAERATGWFRRVAEGMRQLSGNPPLCRLVLVGSATMFIGGTSGPAVFAVVDQGLHRVPEFVGVLTAVQGAGSVVGGLFAGPLLERVSTRVFVGVSVVLFATSVLLRATTSLPMVVVASLLAGVSLPWTLIAIATSVQRNIPSAYLGRVAGTVQTLTFAPNAVGQATCAGLLAIVDYRLMLIVLGVTGLLTSVGCVWRFPPPPVEVASGDGAVETTGSAEPTGHGSQVR